MIEVAHGNILDADAEALVNTVNCVGVMGRGLALQFKKAYPGNFTAYQTACSRNELEPGRMFVFDLGQPSHPRYVINFPTKRHWRGKSRLEDIEAGLVALAREVRDRRIGSIAIPPLGCGLGGLPWEVVRPLIEQTFEALPGVRVLLYEPHGAPKATAMVNRAKCPRMTAGRAALLGLMRRYLAALMDDSVTLLELHKLMYFMQEAGEPLRLKYAKAPYGPYAENLRHVLNAVEGHFIIGYGDGEDAPAKPIELLPAAADRAETFLADHPTTRQRFDRVVDVISGFETPYGMELLSTVHWVAAHEKAATPDDAVAATYRWNQRKRMFSREHLRLAWETLDEAGWLS